MKYTEKLSIISKDILLSKLKWIVLTSAMITTKKEEVTRLAYHPISIVLISFSISLKLIKESPLETKTQE